MSGHITITPQPVQRLVLESVSSVVTNDDIQWRLRNEQVNRLALVHKGWREFVADAGECSTLQRAITITPLTAAAFADALARQPALTRIGHLCGEWVG